MFKNDSMLFHTFETLNCVVSLCSTWLVWKEPAVNHTVHMHSLWKTTDFLFFLKVGMFRQFHIIPVCKGRRIRKLSRLFPVYVFALRTQMYVKNDRYLQHWTQPANQSVNPGRTYKQRVSLHNRRESEDDARLRHFGLYGLCNKTNLMQTCETENVQ